MVVSEQISKSPFDTRARQEELHRAIRRPPAPQLPYGPEELESSIADRFERVAALVPDNDCVRSARSSVTYSELNRQANRLAHHLLQTTAGEARAVGLMFEHGVDTVTAVMGVLKSGGFYVPLDPTYPEDRLLYMIEDSGLETIVTDEANLSNAHSLAGANVRVVSISDIPGDTPDSNPSIELTPDSYAYVVYTSGSTGKPKGVVEIHRNVKWFSGMFLETDRISPSDVILGSRSLSFSGHASLLFACLLNGATSLMVHPRTVHPKQMLELIRSHRASYMTLDPPLFRRLFEADDVLDGMPDARIVRFGGSSANRTDFENLSTWAPGATFRHSMGTSEVKHICSYIVTADSELHGPSVPVGYEAPGIEVLLLDEDGDEVPNGEVGEIVVRSPYICPGYWNRPDLNAERFYGDEPGGENRYYRTGDLGIRDENGCLFHRGRKDFQVKVRGYRVEVNEVEENLKAIAGIRDAAVIGQVDDRGDTSLVSFIVLDAEMPSTASLRRELSKSVPHYMMPAAFIEVDRMPETPNGKLDRNGFPEVDLSTDARASIPGLKREPVTGTESRLIQIWQDALQRQDIGVDEDYFDFGGDSLMAAVIFDQVFRVFGKRIAINALFETPTVGELAKMIDSVVPESTPVVPIRPSGSKTPIFCFHSLGGSVLGYYGLAKYLPSDYPVWAIQPRGVDGREKPISSITGMARYYASVITRIQESGPLIVTGISLGGLIAFEVARELVRQGRDLQKLVLIDSNAPTRRGEGLLFRAWDRAKKLRQDVSYLPYDLRSTRLPPEKSRDRIYRNNIRASRNYRNSLPQPVEVPAVLIRGRDNGQQYVTEAAIAKWRELTQSDLPTAEVTGAHVGPDNYMLDEPNVEGVAREFLRLIQGS